MSEKLSRVSFLTANENQPMPVASAPAPGSASGEGWTLRTALDFIETELQTTQGSVWPQTDIDRLKTDLVQRGANPGALHPGELLREFLQAPAITLSEDQTASLRALEQRLPLAEAVNPAQSKPAGAAAPQAATTLSEAKEGLGDSVQAQQRVMQLAAAQSAAAAQAARQPVTQLTGLGAAAYLVGRFVKQAAAAISGGGSSATPDSANAYGINDPARQPSKLLDIAMERAQTSARALGSLPGDAKAEDVAKAKGSFREAAGDVENYMRYEHDALLRKVSRGELNEFEARDAAKARSTKLQQIAQQAADAPAVKSDAELAKEIDDLVKRTMEMVRNIIDAFKKVAQKLLSPAAEEEGAKPAASKPAPGR